MLKFFRKICDIFFKPRSEVVDNTPKKKEFGAIVKNIFKKREKDAKKKKAFDWKMFFLRMGRKNLLDFVDQLATLLNAGITILEALKIIFEQTRKKKYKYLYGLMIKDINAGKSLAECMNNYPRIFPPIYAALVETGEKSGALPEVLSELHAQLEEQDEFISKIKGAMIYPVVIMFLSLVLVVGLLTFVVPRISAMYSEAHVNLPALTQKLIDISDYLKTSGHIILFLVFAVFLILHILIKKIPLVRKIWERCKFSIPVFGELEKKKILIMFVGNLGFLLKHGVLISEALPITKKTLDSLLYQEELERINKGVMRGEPMSKLLISYDKKGNPKEYFLFPYEISQLVRIGENTGLVHKILIKIKENYLKNINNMVKNLSSLLEPFLIVFIGTLVGTILLAIMMPFFYIGSTIN